MGQRCVDALVDRVRGVQYLGHHEGHAHWCPVLRGVSLFGEFEFLVDVADEVEYANRDGIEQASEGFGELLVDERLRIFAAVAGEECQPAVDVGLRCAGRKGLRRAGGLGVREVPRKLFQGELHHLQPIGIELVRSHAAAAGNLLQRLFDGVDTPRIRCVDDSRLAPGERGIGAPLRLARRVRIGFRCRRGPRRRWARWRGRGRRTGTGTREPLVGVNGSVGLRAWDAACPPSLATTGAAGGRRVTLGHGRRGRWWRGQRARLDRRHGSTSGTTDGLFGSGCGGHGGPHIKRSTAVNGGAGGWAGTG